MESKSVSCYTIRSS